jgi:glycosyltransferase involved in cell wall biosynthesis
VKILHVLLYTELGGIENYTRNLFVELEKQGHGNVLVVGGNLIDRLQSENRSVHPLPSIVDFSPAANVELIRNLSEILAREKPDVAFLHTAMNAAASFLLVKRLPSVYFAHNYGAFCPSGALYYRHTNAICEFDTAPNWGCLSNAYVQGCNTRRPKQLLASYKLAQETKAWTQSTDAVVCDSEYVKARHIRAGFDGERIHVLPSPVLIPSVPTPTPTIRDTVIFCGRLVQNKGLETLIDAVTAIDPPVRLVIAGEGPLRESLTARAAALGLARRVEFLGRLSEQDLSSVYARASVVVVPSEWPEPLGMVGPEALGHGRPVVGTAMGGSSEWLKAGVTGLVVPTRDPAELAKAVNRLVGDAELSDRLGRAGRKLVEERFSLEGHTKRLVSVFEAAQNHHLSFRSGATPKS